MMSICAKFAEKTIDSNNIWGDDVLNRQKVANDFTKIIQEINQPFVISINAQYGMGKSFFLKRWAKSLENDVVIFFNAWDNDFQKEPLTPFISTFIKALPQKSISSTAVKSILKAIKGAVDLAIECKTGVENVTGKIISSMGDEPLKDYEKIQKDIEGFKKEIAKIAQNKKIFVFIDELERCRPTYAVELLEAIKHLFNINGLMFILGIDREQLKHTIANLYGQGMDGEGYIKRFIDFELSLPTPSPSAFCSMLSNHFGISNGYSADKDTYANGWECFNNYFSYFASQYNLSLREISQCYTEVNIIHKTLLDKECKLMPILSWLLILKHKKFLQYKNIEEKNFKYIENNYLKDMADKEHFRFTSFRIILRAVAVGNLQNQKNTLATQIEDIKKLNARYIGNGDIERLKEVNEEFNELTKSMEELDSAMDFRRSLSISFGFLHDENVLEIIKNKLSYLS